MLYDLATLADDGEQTLPPYIAIPGGPQPGPRGLPELKGDQGPPGPKSGGVTYVRWGRSTCPNITGTELVYKGRAAANYYSHKGGGGNYQCLTEEPANFDYGPGTVDASYMYGVEYEMYHHQTSNYRMKMPPVLFAMLLHVILS